VADIGVDAALDVELRGADGRRPDAEVRVDDCRQAERVAVERIADRLRERQAEVAEVGLLALEDVLRDAAGERQRLGTRAGRQGVGQHQLRGQPLRWLPPNQPGDHVGPGVHDALFVGWRERLAQGEGDPEIVGDGASRTVDARQPPLAVAGDQARADRHGRRRDDLAVQDQRQLGAPAADVDVEQRPLVAA
jgi:hypothetical protein